MSDSRLYFRQLLSGRDFATEDPLAVQMVNFSYLIGDRDSGQALVVDPAYGVGQILDVATADGMRVVGALATHHHPDHVGGSMMGYTIEGLTALLERVSVPVHAHREEAALITRVTGLDPSGVIAHHGGDRVSVGGIEVELLHTPGHTPGSQCFLVDGMLIAGDTLFLQGCGRTDLPGSDPESMYESLQRLAALPGNTVIYPGHRYSVASAGTLDAVRETNMVFKPATKEAWLSAFR
ncbi:MAG TPA: MBL fold metallo-hydrolase [Acidimicrobiales bacterium]|nr:MBL fold metallo-hydrolase [Acidimicrobiales bacterium]